MTQQHVILVHGCAADNGTPSEAFKGRLERGFDLYREKQNGGQPPVVIVSGRFSPRAMPDAVWRFFENYDLDAADVPVHPDEAFYDHTEAAIGAEYLQQRGLPDEQILTEFRSVCTFSNMVLSLRLLQGEGYDLSRVQMTSVGPDWQTNRMRALSGWLGDIYNVQAWNAEVLPDQLAYGQPAYRLGLLMQESDRIWGRILEQMRAFEERLKTEPDRHPQDIFHEMFVSEFHSQLGTILLGNPEQAMDALYQLYNEHLACRAVGYKPAEAAPAEAEQLSL